MSRKTKLYALWAFLVCIVMIFGYLAIWTDRNFTVYNGDFKILNYGVFEVKAGTANKGKVRTFYEGNQTVGRIRAKLKQRFGLKFIRESRKYVTTMPVRGGRTFFLRFRVEGPFEEVYFIRAVLTDGKKHHEELPGTIMNAGEEDTFVGVYCLPRLPMSNDSLRIDFKLESSDDPIATWRLGKLN
jgi:hypothetical protein